MDRGCLQAKVLTLNCSGYPDRRPLVACCLALSALQLAGGVATAAELSADAVFFDALRQRRLYRLATVACQRRLADQQLDQAARAEMLIQWCQTASQHARYVPAAERPALYQRAFQAVDAYLQQSPPPMQALLVRTQYALLQLSRGELQRQQAALSAQPDDGYQQARTSIRAAIRGLEELQTMLQSPTQFSSAKDELSDDQRLSLRHNLSFQMARALRNQALVYPENSNDRIAALGQALARLQPLASAVPMTSLVWDAVVDEVSCYRLLKDFGQAGTRLQTALSGSPPQRQQWTLQAEQLRIALDAGRMQVVTELLTALEVNTPWLDQPGLAPLHLAMAESYVRLFADADRAGQTSQARLWQRRAATVVEKMEPIHGTFWVRSAELLLASTARSGSSDASVEVLVRAADTKYRQRHWDEAKQGYLQAEAKAGELSQDSLAFQLGYKAAVIEHQRDDHAAAMAGFRRVATSYPQAAEAAAAHLLAIWHASESRKQSPQQPADAYRQLLQEHLRLWPRSPSADQARWWLAALEAQAGRPDQGIRLLQEISPTAESFPAAWQKLVQHYQSALRDANNQQERQQVVGRATRYFASIGAADSAKDEVVRQTLLESARIRMAGSSQDRRQAIAALEQALDPAAKVPGDWEIAARHVLTEAYAREGNYTQARHVFQLASGDNADDILQLVQRLSRASVPESQSQQMARLQSSILMAIDPDTLSAADRLRWHAAGAEALAIGGDPQQAIQRYQPFAEKYPDDGDVQETFARILSHSQAATQQALQQWRTVVQGSPPGSPRYYRAKLGLARTHVWMHDPQKAARIIRLMQALDPEMGGPDMKRQFEALLAQITEP